MQLFSANATIFKKNKSLEYLPISNIQGFIKSLIEVHIFAKFHPQMVHRLFLFCPVIHARRSIYWASGVLSLHCNTKQGRKGMLEIDQEFILQVSHRTFKVNKEAPPTLRFYREFVAVY